MNKLIIHYKKQLKWFLHAKNVIKCLERIYKILMKLMNTVHIVIIIIILMLKLMKSK